MKMLIYIKGNYREVERITTFDIVSIWNKYVQFVSTLIRIYKIRYKFYLDIFNDYKEDGCKAVRFPYSQGCFEKSPYLFDRRGYRALLPVNAASSPGPSRRLHQKAASVLPPLFELPPAQMDNVCIPTRQHQP